MRGGVFTVRAPLIAVGFACFLWALPAGGAAQAIDPAQACSGDAMRLCGQFIPDHAKIAGCLARNRSSLSPDCLQVFNRGSGRATKARMHDGRPNITVTGHPLATEAAHLLRSNPASLRLDVGRPDHLAPLLGFVGDELAEVGGRAAQAPCRPGRQAAP